MKDILKNCKMIISVWTETGHGMKGSSNLMQPVFKKLLFLLETNELLDFIFWQEETEEKKSKWV